MKELIIAFLLMTVPALHAIAQTKEDPLIEGLKDGKDAPRTLQSSGWFVVDSDSNPISVSIGTEKWCQLVFRIQELERKTDGLKRRVYELEHPPTPIHFNFDVRPGGTYSHPEDIYMPHSDLTDTLLWMQCTP